MGPPDTPDHEGDDTSEPENVEVLLQGDTEAELGLEQAFQTDNGAGTFALGDRWTDPRDGERCCVHGGRVAHARTPDRRR